MSSSLLYERSCEDFFFLKIQPKKTRQVSNMWCVGCCDCRALIIKSATKMTRGGCACGHLGSSLVFVPKIDAARRQRAGRNSGRVPIAEVPLSQVGAGGLVSG